MDNPDGTIPPGTLTGRVALVSFDGVVRGNRAVTRDRLGKAPGTPRPLSAAVEQWQADAPRVRAWAELRRRNARAGVLHLTVGHWDLLALPPKG